MFKIIKKGSNNFWHIYNNGAKNVSISDFEVVLDDVLNTFAIVLKNGANIPQIALSVLDIIVIDETTSSFEETFLTASQLRARLVVLGYTAYLGAGNADAITGLISEGTNVTITGTGTLADPYVISSSGGSGTTPTLQEVVVQGNYSPLDIQIDVAESSKLKFVDGQDNVRASFSGVDGTFTFEDTAVSGNNFTTDGTELTDGSKILATREWTNDQIPTTATDLDALKRDGSNANSDVDLGDYVLKAKIIKIGGATPMEVKSDNLTDSRTAQWQDKNYTGIADITDVPTYLSELSEDATHRLVTDTEKSTWNGKQDLLGFTPYKYVQTSQTAHTGTLSETIVATATINGGTFNSDDVMKAIFKATKTATTSNVTMRLRINTTNSLSGATTIATLSFTTANLYAKMKRDFDLRGGNLYGYSFASSLASDDTNVNTLASSTTYNTANTLYFFWTLQLGTSGDSVIPNLANLTN